jgi:hypothetical protein
MGVTTQALSHWVDEQQQPIATGQVVHHARRIRGRVGHPIAEVAPGLRQRYWLAREKAAGRIKYTRGGGRHWLVVPNAPALGGAHDVTIVGFFGDLRPGMNHAAIYALEADGVAGLGRYAPVGLLGY